MNERAKQILTLVATFLGILGPSLVFVTAEAADIGEVSGRFFRDVLIIPADYAFAIWTPIYLGFLAFAVYQALPAQRFNPRFRRVRLWLVGSSLLNAAWITAFANLRFGLSLVIIVAMLVTALVMHRALEIGETRVYGLERLLRLPFSLYAGWLTAATILNTAGVLAVNGWSGFGLSDTAWGVVMLLVASAVGLITRYRWHDPVYGAVFVWAFIGVVVARSEAPVISLTAGVLALMFLVSLFVLNSESSQLRDAMSAKA